MTFDKPILIRKRNEETEQFELLYSLHARVNKTGGSEYVNSGTNRSKSTRTFEVRYFKDLEDIDVNRGLYNILYRGNVHNIVDYDDFLDQHKTVKLIGESC